MDAYEEAARLIRDNAGRLDYSGGAADEAVREAEERLGVRFPEDYRRFLREFGAGGLGGVEVYGIPRHGLDAEAVPNGVWYTKLHWEEGTVRRGLVVIGSVGDGSLFCLDPRDGRVTVLEPDPEGGEVVEELAPDFGTFLRDAVRAELESRP